MPHSEWITVTAIGGIALILALATAITALCRRIRQPAVIGEITIGICLGPSLLGLFPGDLPDRLFPAEIRPHLGVVSQVGLLLFMFIIGWEFNSGALKGRFRSTGAIWMRWSRENVSSWVVSLAPRRLDSSAVSAIRLSL